MPAIARVGIDSCGGLIIGNLAPNCKVDGSPIVLVGAAIAAHGIGSHAAAVMVQGSSKVKVNGISVCRVGDAASCGHTITSGSPKSNAGG